ncbi:MAG: hypothetical protein HY324_01520, partial [Chlamydiia bacterium]|nr:hypothetical protein [Chlamydiia bacterium]
LKEEIWREIQKLVVNCDAYREENPQMALQFLERARNSLKEKPPRYEEALELYREAYHFTRSSLHYKEVVDLYAKMKRNGAVECANLYLMTLQMGEGEFSQAAETGEKLGSRWPGKKGVQLFLKLRSGQLSIEEVIQQAKGLPYQEMKDLYLGILCINPMYFPAYFALAAQCETLTEEKEVLLLGKKVAEEVGNRSILAKFEEQIVLAEDDSRCLITQDEWGNTDAVRARIPWPQELIDLMNGPDQDLYTVFPVTSRLRLHGEIVPATYQNIKKMLNDPNCLNLSIDAGIEANEHLQEDRKVCWAVLTKTVLEGSLLIPIEKKQEPLRLWTEALPEKRRGFTLPGTHEFLSAVLWHLQASGGHEMLYYTDPHLYTHSSEQHGRKSLLAGYSRPTKLDREIEIGYCMIEYYDRLGTGAMRLFL